MEGRRRVVQNLVNISCGDASRVEGPWVSPSFRGRRTWSQASQSADPGGPAWGEAPGRAGRRERCKLEGGKGSSTTGGAGWCQGYKVLSPGRWKSCSLSTDLHILALAAPGSFSGCPKAARRVFQGASGALREQLLGVPGHSEGNFWAFSRLRGRFFGDLRRHFLRERFFRDLLRHVRVFRSCWKLVQVSRT